MQHRGDWRQRDQVGLVLWRDKEDLIYARSGGTERTGQKAREIWEVKLTTE